MFINLTKCHGKVHNLDGRDRHVQLTMEGLKRAREKGIVGGRPTISKQKIKRIEELKEKELSNREIGKILNITHRTVGKYLLNE